MPSAAPSFPGLRVLLAEDNWSIALTMSTMLEDWGCTVVSVAADCASAEDLAATADADCAVLDIELLDGLCYSAAERAAARGMAVIFTSGYDTPPDLPPALRDTPWLVKPVAPAHLQRALQSLLETRNA
ncbi:response regulator receiver protein [Caenispirillum salinarum AK4]|uniref:Response regulator receiver protein n=1 Tax=Caenispirillum salinarum AK4 TaxID=1238182 RepID=K9HJY7_9PROT|nr:response regulator [Caenispirillum salinarum]EKV28926.1 response regulator receiver protein [Caenispirillum salinarum AK4]